MITKHLILIDGNAILHRAYHAIPPFQTSKGELVNAVYGFASMLINILTQKHPEYLAVAFDRKAPTFRHAEYKEYKATRVKAPDDLYPQLPRIQELLKIIGIPIFEMDGYEADDILGALAAQASTQGILTSIVTGDKDTLQLITDKISVVMPIKGFSDNTTYTPQAVLAKFGLNPSQIPDFKGLSGDNSDNIKGVAGIGPKTATTLLQKYGTIENLYKHLDENKAEEIPKGTKEKLLRGREDALFSKRMATLITDLPLKLDISCCDIGPEKLKCAVKFFEELEFKSLLKKLENLGLLYKPKPESSQQSLF